MQYDKVAESGLSVFSINSPHEELLLVGGVNNSIPAGNTFPLAGSIFLTLMIPTHKQLLFFFYSK